MARSLYLLGLAKSASAAEVKSAFRKLAKKFHPDQSKESRAKERFAEIGSAYEILGDEKKRAPTTAARSTPRASRARRSSRASVSAGGRARAANSMASTSMSAATPPRAPASRPTSCPSFSAAAWAADRAPPAAARTSPYP